MHPGNLDLAEDKIKKTRAWDSREVDEMLPTKHATTFIIIGVSTIVSKGSN